MMRKTSLERYDTTTSRRFDHHSNVGGQRNDSVDSPLLNLLIAFHTLQ